jgi:predicted Zn-dependent protease
MDAIGMKARIAASALAVLLAGCETLGLRLGDDQGVMPQRSDLFQLSNQAQLAYEAGEDARAEQLYMGLARKTPNDPEVWLRLGNLYARSNRPDAAADAYQRVLSIDGSEPRAWYNLGIVRLRQGWAAMAQAHLGAPPQSPIHLQSGELLDHLGRMTAVPPPPNAPAGKSGASRP